VLVRFSSNDASSKRVALNQRPTLERTGRKLPDHFRIRISTKQTLALERHSTAPDPSSSLVRLPGDPGTGPSECGGRRLLCATVVVQPIVAARPKRSFIRTVLPSAIGGKPSSRSYSGMAALRKQPSQVDAANRWTGRSVPGGILSRCLNTSAGCPAGTL
jgi:hypothetical protein